MGLIMFDNINYPPVSWYDARVAPGLINKVVTYIAFCVDQGFPRSGLLEGTFVEPLSKRQLRNASVDMRELHGRYVSLRQEAAIRA